MSEEAAHLLQEAIAAAKAGNKAAARRLLIEVTERDERNEEAWLWLSGVVDDLEEMQICLENVIEINPANERARQGLAWVKRRLAEQAPPSPPRPYIPAPPPIEEQIVAAPEMPPPPLIEEEEIDLEPTNRVPCPACGAMNFDFATECVKCNFPFAITCSSCNELVPTDTGFCPHCDAELPLPQKLDTVREREVRIDDAYREGLAHMQEGRYQEARVSFEEVASQDPGHVEVLYNLGLACAKLGLRGEAREYWEEVQALQPEYPDIEKDLESLLSARDRRRLAKQRKQALAAERKKREEEAPIAGRTLIYEYEQQLEEERRPPPPEEEMGGVEAFIYVLVVGLVLGVAYALNQPISEAGLSTETIFFILKQAGVITVLLILFWVILTIVSRLLSLIFRGAGRAGGYMACATRFLMPFFLLIIPIVLGIPQVVDLLPESISPWAQYPFEMPLLGELPPLPWVLFGVIALFWGLFAFARGIGRVGRIALWKGFLVALVTVAIAGGAVYGGYLLVDSLGYMELLKEQLEPPPTPIPSPTPEGTPPPSPEVTPSPGL